MLQLMVRRKPGPPPPPPPPPRPRAAARAPAQEVCQPLAGAALGGGGLPRGGALQGGQGGLPEERLAGGRAGGRAGARAGGGAACLLLLEKGAWSAWLASLQGGAGGGSMAWVAAPAHVESCIGRRGKRPPTAAAPTRRVQIVREMNAQRPWVMKDNRFGYTAPLWWVVGRLAIAFLQASLAVACADRHVVQHRPANSVVMWFALHSLRSCLAHGHPARPSPLPLPRPLPLQAEPA